MDGLRDICLEIESFQQTSQSPVNCLRDNLLEFQRFWSWLASFDKPLNLQSNVSKTIHWKLRVFKTSECPVNCLQAKWLDPCIQSVKHSKSQSIVLEIIIKPLEAFSVQRSFSQWIVSKTMILIGRDSECFVPDLIYIYIAAGCLMSHFQIQWPKLNLNQRATNHWPRAAARINERSEWNSSIIKKLRNSEYVQ